MKKTLIAASVALAVSLSACGKNDASGNVAANDTALDGTIESGLESNDADASGNVTIGEDESILDNATVNAADPVANTQ